MSTPTDRDLDRQAHPAPAHTDQYGQRTTTPDPAPADIVRNFGWTREHQ